MLRLLMNVQRSRQHRVNVLPVDLMIQIPFRPGALGPLSGPKRPCYTFPPQNGVAPIAFRWFQSLASKSLQHSCNFKWLAK